MSAKVSLLAISVAVLLLPWLLWRVRAVRRVAPLAVVQILVGVALGPSCFGQAAPELHDAIFTRPVLAAIDGVASVGVLLYVLVTGLHLDVVGRRREFRRLGAVAFGSVSVPLLLGLGVGWWMLHSTPSAVGALGDGPALVAAVAICIAVTALPVLAAVLQEMGLLGSRIGQTALALAAINDAALWIMLAALLALSGREGGRGLIGLGAAVLWFGFLLLAVRPGLDRLSVMEERARLVVAVSLTVLSACLSEALGTGYLIGAFAVGAIIPSAWRPALLGQLELVAATVLLPFFFMSTGLKAFIEPGSASFLALLGGATAATMVGKAAGTALPARLLGYSWAESLCLGAMMQTKGLMEVVVLAVLHDAGLLGTQIFSAMVAMAVVCTVVTAPAVRLCQALERRSTPDAAAVRAS